jgi:ubiquinone biosynthesis protein COQ4
MSLEYKIDYLRAYKAFKKLCRNPANTIFIFEILYALNPPSLRWSLEQLMRTESGGEVAYTSEEISEYFQSLSERPEGSVGRECHKLFPNQEILLKLSRRKSSNSKWIEAKHPYNWMARRYRDTHDTWHTLTGYPANDTGEICLAAFSFAQTKSIGWIAICLLGLLKYGLTYKNLSMVQHAYLRGKNAKFLLAENYDDLFNEDLEEARIRLNIIS